MYASKTHFKMYKAGKRWLFVGLTAMGFVVGAVNASADVMADTVTENTTHVEAPEIQKNTDSNNTSAASEDTVAKTDEASTSKVSEKVATAENAQATSDSSKDTNSNSKLSKQNNDSINEASVKDNHKTSKAAVTNNTVTSNKVADDTTITESKTNTTPVSKNTDSDQSLVNKDTTREATTNIDNDIDTTQPQEHQKGTDVDVSKALANATVNEDKKSIDNQKKKDEAKKEATKADDNIASGTFGSSDWYIDAQGTLHFGAGEFGVSQIDVVSNNGLEINKNEWGKYASQIKKISFDDKVIANQQSGALFNGLSNLTTIENMQNFDTSNITVMDAIFYDDTNLTDIDVSQWDLSNVYSMYGTFFKCTSVSNLDVSQWNVSKVENMAYTFYEMTNLKALDVSNWDTSNVTNMFYTFLKDRLITVLDVSNWDVSNVENFTGTFSGMSGVKTLDVSHWDTGSATAMGSLFQDTNSLSTLDVSNWNVSNVLSLDFTFLNTGVKTLDVSKWDVSKVTNFFGTFEGVKFSRLDVSDWKTVSATNMSYMFCGSSFGTLNISNLNTDHVVDMSLMFNGIDVKSLDLSSFNTSNVTNMKSMFHGAKSIYKLDISNFDMGKVTNKEGMLTDLTSLRVLVLGSNTIINGTGLSEPNFKGTSNRWVAVAGGNENNPYGAKYYTSTDLMAAYNSSMSDTYVIGEDKSSIAGHDSTIIAGPNSKWTSSDNFSSGTGIDGSPLDFSKVVVGGTVDTETPGNYDVSYTYTDEAGKEVTDTITVHVVASQVSIAGHDSTIIAGPNSKWNAKDNFDSATDAEGNPVEFKDVTANGQVDTQVPGNYEVTYSYTDAYGNEVSKTITVRVIASQASVAGHDSTIIAGPNSKWNASDNFDGATDAEGNPIGLNKVAVTGDVNAQVPGDYEITYSYTDIYGNEASETITVHVIASQVSVAGHDSTIIAGPNSRWNASDNFNGATDVEGNPIDFKDVTTNGQVDPTVVGNYDVTYSYIDAYGNEASKIITVHVIESKVSIDSHDSTIIAGPNSKWDAKDNFNDATDAEGNPVEFKDVIANGQVDPTVVGNYEVIYSYTDAYGNEASKTITVHVIVSQVSVDGHNSTVIAGPSSKWGAKDNFNGATDAEGNPVELNKVSVTGEANAQVPGDYEITYSYTDIYGNEANETITVHVIASQASVAGHDSTIIAGPNSKWNASDNFDSATDAESNPIGLNKVAVTGEVNAQVPGDYEITYSYTDAYGNVVNKTITVHVIASRVSINGHDSTIIAGSNSKWNAKDNFDSATDAEGNPVELSKITVTGEANAQVPGNYEVTYSYTDAYGNEVSKTITVHVIASQASINGHDSTIIAGPNSKWNASDNFDGATDAEGNSVEFKDVTANGQVDPTVVGNYDVVYSYTDAYGNKVNKTITVHVVASQVSISDHDSTIIAGPNSKWNASDNFDGATDAEGNPIGLNKVAVTGEVNAQVSGDYEITYSYTDAYGNLVNKTITVHVIASQVSIAGHDSTIIAGPNSKWDTKDNFDSATDAEGNPVELNKVSVTGEANVQVPGDYEITYSYTDAYGNVVNKTITVHVIASKASVAGHDSTIIAGSNSKWDASDNFDGATDAEGNPVELNKVSVTGEANAQVPGNYDVVYSYIDAYGNKVSKTITVHVIASQASVAGHDSTIIAGSNSKWNTSDNLDSATDAEGDPVELNKVSVTGEANAQVPGNYDVVYSYIDAYGNKVSKTITVHVIASQASVAGHDSTIIAGPNSKWDVKDNFNGATDAEGNSVEFKDVTASGQVDTQVPGDYEIIYSYTDAYGNKVRKTITIHVIASQASVAGHDSTIIAGANSKWNASDNFDGATDAEGNSVELNKVSVTGEANAQVPGNYEVTYSYTDAYGNVVNKTIMVRVVASATPNTPSNPDRPDKSADTDVPDTSMKPSNSDTVGLPTKSKSNNLVKITNKRVANIVPAKKHSKTISTSKVNTLPQTGENDSNIETTIGVMGLLASVMGLIGFGKRRNRED